MNHKLNAQMIVLSLVLLMPVMGWAATYYVDAVNGNDGNAGTSDAPWETMDKAKSLVSAGDTVLLKTGDYGNIVFGNDDTSGTGWGDNEKIVYKASTGATPVFSHLTFSEISGYIEVNGVTINVPDTANGILLLNNVAHFRFLNLIIVGMTEWTIGDSTPISDIGIYLATEGYEDILMEGCKITKFQRGIQVRGYNVGEGIVIRNNEIHFMSGALLKISPFSPNGTVLIENNHLYDQIPRSGAHGSGIEVRSSNIIIRNNILHNAGNSYGIGFYDDPGGGYHDITIENNLIYDIYNYVQAVSIIRYSHDIIVRNNTIVGQHEGTRSGRNWYGGPLRIWMASYGPGGIEVYNNVIVGTLYFADGASPDVMTGNIMWSHLDNGAWKSSSPGNIIYNPGDASEPRIFEDEENFFIGPLDYSLRHGLNLNNSFKLANGSDAIGFADPAYAPGYDILGMTRDSNPDAGCYEYGATVPWPGYEPGPDPEPEPDPEEPIGEPPIAEPEADADPVVVDSTVLSVRNNVIKLSGSAIIRCDLKEAGNLSVKVYDSKGKEIVTLFDGQAAAGRHEFTWSGTDKGGSKVGSGIYMVSMRAGSYEKVKKIAVIK